MQDLLPLLASWPDDPQRFQTLSQAIGDWPALLSQAQSHGVLQILASAWLDAGVCPPGAKVQIEERQAFQRLWAGRIDETLNDVLGRLGGSGIPVVALKGPVLAERLYGDRQARFSLDVDLLVRAEDFQRAAAVLEALGYRAAAGPAARYHLRHHHHLTFHRPQRPTVELHFRAFTGFGTSLDGGEFLARAGSYQTGRAASCLVLAPEDEFLFLAVHAAGHGCQRWSWLYDLKSFLRRQPELDWQAICGRAEAAHLSAALAFTLDALRRRLGVPPGGPGQRDFVRRRRRPAAARLAAWLEGRDENAPGARLGWLVFQALLCDEPRRSLWFLRHHLLRVGRRRLQRALPRVCPEDWGG